jgi:PAS domain S-box-containing protein
VPPNLRTRAWIIAAVYAVFASGWIYFSDAALAALVADPEQLLAWSVYKGWAFVAVTSLLLLLLLLQAFGAIGAGYISLKAKEQELRASRGQLAAIIRSAMDAIITVDAAGKVVLFNAAAERIFGSASADAIGEPLTRFIPEALVGMRGDGERFPLEASVSSTEDDGAQFVTYILRDVTERQRAEARLRGQKQVLEMIAHGEPLHASLDALVRCVEELSPELTCTILLLDLDGVHLHHGAAPSVPDEYVRAIDGSAIGPKAGSCGTAAFRRAPVAVQNIATDPLWDDYRHLALPHGFQACWSTPILDAQKRVLGTFAIYHREPGAPTSEHLQLIDFATQLATVAIGRWRMEGALRESEARFHAFMDASPAVAWVTDEEGRHHYMNTAWERAFGLRREDHIGRTAADLVSPEAAARICASDQRVLDSQRSIEIAEDTGVLRGEPFVWDTIKFPFQNADGQRFVGGIAIDITTRKRAERELLSAQERLELVVEQLHEGLMIAAPDGQDLEANPAALRLLGIADTAEQHLTQPDLDALFDVLALDGTVLGADQRPLVRVRRGEQLQEEELRLRRRGTFWDRIFAFTGGRVTLPNGEMLAFLTFSDITERKRAEKLLRQLNETLEAKVRERTLQLEAAKIRAEAADTLKSAFLATMSHELRTPLNSIIGFTGIVLQELAGPLTAEQSKQLGMVRGSARHLLELINDVLDLSKIEAGQVEVQSAPFALAESVERVMASVRPMAQQKGLALELRVSAEMPEMTSDRRRVEQILLNVLNNAIKFTDRGAVTMTVDLLTDAPLPTVFFRISDTGIGIKREDLGKLFRPFQQVDTGLARQHEGTGLGLSICRRLSDLLGGTIGAESAYAC